MTNKVALVTGGSTGIGAAIAKQLAENNYQVLITGRNENTLKTSAQQHTNISYLIADVGKSADVEKTVAYIKDKYGRLDVLVNNAGIAPPLPFEQFTFEHFDSVFNINVRGLVNMSHKALPLLKESKGNIINISSVVGDKPFANFLAYSASKAAVTNISMTLAKELAPFGIRVNAISPGPIATPIFDKMGMPAEQKDEMATAIGQMVPLGRFGTPDEIASAATYLASDKASYITGVQYKIDGGMSA